MSRTDTRYKYAKVRDPRADCSVHRSFGGCGKGKSAPSRDITSMFLISRQWTRNHKRPPESNCAACGATYPEHWLFTGECWPSCNETAAMLNRIAGITGARGD